MKLGFADSAQYQYPCPTLFKEACVDEWLKPRTPDLKVRGSNLARRVVSLDKELYFTLPLFTQVYKWAGVCDGLASRPGGSSNTSRCFMLRKPV